MRSMMAWDAPPTPKSLRSPAGPWPPTAGRCPGPNGGGQHTVSLSAVRRRPPSDTTDRTIRVGRSVTAARSAPSPPPETDGLAHGGDDARSSLLVPMWGGRRPGCPVRRRGLRRCSARPRCCPFMAPGVELAVREVPAPLRRSSSSSRVHQVYSRLTRPGPCVRRVRPATFQHHRSQAVPDAAKCGEQPRRTTAHDGHPPGPCSRPGSSGGGRRVSRGARSQFHPQSGPAASSSGHRWNASAPAAEHLTKASPASEAASRAPRPAPLRRGTARCPPPFHADQPLEGEGEHQTLLRRLSSGALKRVSSSSAGWDAVRRTSVPRRT